MAVVIRGKDVKGIDKHGNKGPIHYGICNETVENPKIVMGHTITPPGIRRSRLHYHANCVVVQYVISGRRREFVGPEHERTEIDLGPGDFLFIPQGEIHGSMNLSDTETSELVFCYLGVSSREEANTLFVEPPSVGQGL